MLASRALMFTGGKSLGSSLCLVTSLGGYRWPGHLPRHSPQTGIEEDLSGFLQHDPLLLPLLAGQGALGVTGLEAGPALSRWLDLQHALDIRVSTRSAATWREAACGVCAAEVRSRPLCSVLSFENRFWGNCSDGEEALRSVSVSAESH